MNISAFEAGLFSHFHRTPLLNSTKINVFDVESYADE